MNNLQKRIKELEEQKIRMVEEHGSSQTATCIDYEIQGIKFAEQEILKMLRDLERKRLTDNNDYVSFSIKDWFNFTKQIKGHDDE